MDKTEDQIDRERKAVAAMANAKSNMDQALQRIQTLEYRLNEAVAVLSALKGHIGPNAHTYPINGNTEIVHKYVERAVAKMREVL